MSKVCMKGCSNKQRVTFCLSQFVDPVRDVEGVQARKARVE